MPFYETVFIARSDISGPQVETLADAFTQVIEGHGGQIKKREHWGLRSFAYRIKKNRKGHYVLFNVDAPAPAVHELERQMRIHEDVLRYLTIRVDTLEEGPSAIMQSRSGRDDRGRREGRGRDGGRESRESRESREGRGAGERSERSGGAGERSERSGGAERSERSGGAERTAEASDERAGGRSEKQPETEGGEQ